MNKPRGTKDDERSGADRAADTEPAPPGKVPPSQGGYGHKVNKGGSTRPQGGANPIGPETDSAGHKGRAR